MFPLVVAVVGSVMEKSLVKSLLHVLDYFNSM
ncbi:hypothetical protein ACJIZ3_002669 [Penstemon smallii]|uniref:Uncharacterized protein n=1 Tax=Penstemon smallii TaxID=265156 RepID=A0ABD3U8X4_9LAMI